MLEILQEWLNTYEDSKPHLRLGQSLMCAIYDTNQKFYTNITGTEFDCFYLDSVIPKTLLKLEESMEV